MQSSPRTRRGASPTSIPSPKGLLAGACTNRWAPPSPRSFARFTRATASPSKTPVQRALREGLVINLHGDAILLSKGGENPLQLDSQTIPVIASFNGSTASGWTSFAKQIQQAGADALELNLY